MSPIRRAFNGGELVAEIEPSHMRSTGQPCIAIEFPDAGIKLRITLEDAETFGEALIKAVRAAETEQH